MYSRVLWRSWDIELEVHSWKNRLRRRLGGTAQPTWRSLEKRRMGSCWVAPAKTVTTHSREGVFQDGLVGCVSCFIAFFAIGCCRARVLEGKFDRVWKQPKKALEARRMGAFTVVSLHSMSSMMGIRETCVYIFVLWFPRRPKSVFDDRQHYSGLFNFRGVYKNYPRLFLFFCV